MDNFSTDTDPQAFPDLKLPVDVSTNALKLPCHQELLYCRARAEDCNGPNKRGFVVKDVAHHQTFFSGPDSFQLRL